MCLLLEVARICTQLFFGSRDDFAFLKEIARIRCPWDEFSSPPIKFYP